MGADTGREVGMEMNVGCMHMTTLRTNTDPLPRNGSRRVICDNKAGFKAFICNLLFSKCCTFKFVIQMRFVCKNITYLFLYNNRYIIKKHQCHIFSEIQYGFHNDVTSCAVVSTYLINIR